MLAVLPTCGTTGLVALADPLQAAPMRMVDRLIGAVLADRRVSPGNRCEVSQQLTEEGRPTVGHVMARRRGEIAAIVEGLSAIWRP
ncbi:hypothetical protein ACIRJO_27005 [Streptomyces sp. NPDC102394]|uniref:hypothetical protein n=1 Tax=Streptomyces sp. NPDC102394 TaxID=3366167 RepID=UPI0038151BA9